VRHPLPKPYALGATKNPIGWPQLHIHSLYDFIAAVAGGPDHGPTFADGLAANRFVVACQSEAALKGRRYSTDLLARSE